ncbi:hypothetical protein [Saccharothrix lopnurensis]|uniref:Uncharacterized protein n=1 Tax=Saccharothrix lopnurensis TaxID=1670621 RepID=A0ABW1PDP7_9PSEU
MSPAVERAARVAAFGCARTANTPEFDMPMPTEAPPPGTGGSSRM